MKFEILDSISPVGMIEKQGIVDFLHEHLEEYGDSKDDIMNALDYALSESSMQGGFVLKGYEDDTLAGIVLMNKTGMKGYNPENILVYIAVNKDFRGKGLGKQLMQKIISMTEGDIKLHVEPENPARFLYEKVGFENKYLEYRFKQKK
jgi:ribosomal protein S18 acetylase RimI-like enzyme